MYERQNLSNHHNKLTADPIESKAVLNYIKTHKTEILHRNRIDLQIKQFSNNNNY